MKWQPNRGQLLLRFKPKRYTTIVMMLVIWTGVAGSLFAAIGQDIRNKDALLGRAITIADTLPASEVATLKGNNNDTIKPSYKNLKERLEKVRADNADLSFVFIMGMHDNTVFYYLDSEVPDSLGYSAPGTVYDAASAHLKAAFISTKPYVEGPTHDKYGRWMAAHAPITDSKTGRIVGVVGVEVKARTYYEQIIIFAIIPLLLAAIPLAGLMRDRRLESKEHEITQLKNQFVSIASHELRSPLAGMLWAIQSLLKSTTPDSPKTQVKLLHDMYRSTAASLSTVNEILDMSIFERGQAQKLQHEQVDLVTVVQEAIATLRLGAQEHTVHIKKVGTWPDEANTLGDVGALKRSYMNLLSNAIKYSHDDGAVEIGYRHANGEHIISVKDHGIGIPVAEQAKVLDGYYRATNATQKQAHGTGLGLWLARKLAEQHGGRLWLRSQVNHGTTIYMALPDRHASTTGLKQS
ncbi:MAG: hypothetical protein NVS1B7_1080 [Candidatus Saccharimonadales bacterium]